MITRQTSAAVYHRIKAEGLLSTQRLAIYEVLYHQGPMTISECFDVLAKRTPNFNWNTRTRFGELREQGAIYEVRERPCRVTGETVIEWDVTDNLPIPLKRGRAPLSKRSLETLRVLWREAAATGKADDVAAIERVVELAKARK